ncbi:MAG: hypothetical protein HY875_11220 [Chloroflexi bacterium]|nr:hypothetical protein [Chloroflexota bacterium]
MRNVPAALLVRDLTDEFEGVARDESTVTGDGWLVRFIPGEPVRMGLTVVPVLFIEVSGEREAEAAAFVRRKCIRGGG